MACVCTRYNVRSDLLTVTELYMYNYQFNDSLHMKCSLQVGQV